MEIVKKRHFYEQFGLLSTDNFLDDNIGEGIA